MTGRPTAARMVFRSEAITSAGVPPAATYPSAGERSLTTGAGRWRSAALHAIDELCTAEPAGPLRGRWRRSRLTALNARVVRRSHQGSRAVEAEEHMVPAL